MVIIHHVMTLFPGLFCKDQEMNFMISFFSHKRVHNPLLKQQGEEGWPGEDVNVCFSVQTLLSWWEWFSFIIILNYYLLIVHECSWIRVYHDKCVEVRGQLSRFHSLYPGFWKSNTCCQVCKISTWWASLGVVFFSFSQNSNYVMMKLHHTQ